MADLPRARPQGAGVLFGKNVFDTQPIICDILGMKIQEFLKQMNIRALAVAKMKKQINKKNVLTIIKSPVTL